MVKKLHVKFTAVLKNYQDNTILTMQLQNTSDQSNIPVTLICENGTYTGFADLPINTDTYNATACIDTDGSKTDRKSEWIRNVIRPWIDRLETPRWNYRK